MSDSALPSDPLFQAASLAFAMLRFEAGAAHPPRGHVPAGMPRLGEDVYTFAPSPRKVPCEAVPQFLAELTSPAALFPTTTRGFVALLLLEELSGERAQWARKEFANQQAGLEEMAGQLHLKEDSRILLEFAAEEHVVSLAVFRRWSERFAVGTGWSLSALENDPRASARLNLFRSDGINTPGAPGPAHPPEQPAA